jgi:hypothetical protein
MFAVACPLWHASSRADSGEGQVADPLVLDPVTVDFGRVNNASGPLELSFKIKNRGDQPIEITGARTGCGCTVAKLSKSVVAPRDHIVVSVTVNILGRLGKFENRVLLDVVERAEPVAVNVRGTIIQDLWFNGPVIQCLATDSAAKVEKTFEVYTVDWPLAQFHWNLPDKGISIGELSRTNKGDETVIKFRLLVDAPTSQTSTTWHLTLVPLDKRIQPLTIPVVCYRPSLRNKEDKETSHVLRPDRISLGVIPSGEDRRFEVSGPSKLVNSFEVAGLENFPEGTKVELHHMNDVDEDSFGVTIRFGKSASSGLLDGRIRLKSPYGSEHSIEVLGILGPEGSAKKSGESKRGQESSQKSDAKPSGTKQQQQTAKGNQVR